MANFYPYEITNSLRMSGTSNMERTQLGGSSKKMTISLWFKRVNLGIDLTFAAAGVANVEYLKFNTSDNVRALGNGGVSYEWVSDVELSDTNK